VKISPPPVKKLFGSAVILALLLYHFFSFYGGAIGVNRSESGKTEYSDAETVIKLDGLVFRKSNGYNFTLKSISPDSTIDITALNASDTEKYTFKIINVNPERVEIKGANEENIKRTRSSVIVSVARENAKKIETPAATTIPIATSARHGASSTAGGLRRIEISQKQKDFFFYVWSDSKSESPFSNIRGGYFVTKKIVDAAKKERPLFMMAMGDLMPSPKYHHYRRLNAFIKKMSPIPFYSAPGNHDSAPKTKKMWEKAVSPPYYSFIKNGFLFIILDNSDGSFGSEQLAWLENKLKNNKNQKALLFFHKPLYDPRPDRNYVMENEKERDALAQLLDKYAPAAVFASHIHGFWHYKKGETDFFITGGAGAKLYQINGFYHFLKFFPGDNGCLKWEIIKVTSSITPGFIFEFFCNLIFVFFVMKFLILRKTKNEL